MHVTWLIVLVGCTLKQVFTPAVASLVAVAKTTEQPAPRFVPTTVIFWAQPSSLVAEVDGVPLFAMMPVTVGGPGVKVVYPATAVSDPHLIQG